MEKFEPINLQKHIEAAREVVKKPEKKEKSERREEALRVLPKEEAPIFQLQVRKQEIMRRLKTELRAIEKGRGFSNQDQRLIDFRPESGLFEFQGGGERNYRLTFGDMISDMRWGINYYPDKKFPKNLRKRLVMERARAEISNLYDQQLIFQRTHDMGVDPFLRHAYKASRRILMEEAQLEHSAGHIFERMIQNLLLQIMHDKPELGVKVNEVNVVEDVEGKIDFVIKVKRKRRGVAMEEGGETDQSEAPIRVMGIQFTLWRSDSEKFQKKMDQLRRVRGLGIRSSSGRLDDILLISVPVSAGEIINRYKQWKQLGKPPGGPEAFWDINTRVAFVKAVLRQMGIDDLLEEKEDELREYYNSRLVE